MSLGPLTVLRRVGTPGDVDRCTRVRIVFHSACTSTRQDQDSSRVSAHVSVPVGYFIGEGPGACPVASIGLRNFRVYRGVLGMPGTPWSADRPGQVFVVSAHWHSSSYCVARGARGHNILPKPKLPQITFLDLGGLRYPTLRSGIAPPNLGLLDTILCPSEQILCPSDQNNQARYPLGCKDHKILACAFNLLFS